MGSSEHAVADAAGGSLVVRDRAEDWGDSLEEEDGVGRAWRHTGLSPAMLSKVERGQLFPTLPTLLRIALVFSVGLDYFFAAERDKPAWAVARHQQAAALSGEAGRLATSAYEFEFRSTFRRS